MSIPLIDETLVYFEHRLPEHNLFSAVLERALRDLQENVEHHHTRDAIGWLNGKADKDDPFCFPRVAEELELTVSHIRKIQVMVTEAENRIYGEREIVSRYRPWSNGRVGALKRIFNSKV